MRHAVLWDLDGTLLDTLADLHAATNYALAAFGCPPRSMEEVRRFVGNGAGLLIRRALPGLPTDPAPEAVLDVFRTYYNAHCQEQTRPYAGIPEALEILKDQGFSMAVVSNKPDSAVKPLCRQYFGDIPAFGETKDCPRKPAPDMVLRAAKMLGVALSDCVYVGDSEVDVATAGHAGIACLSVLWGFRDRQALEQAGAVHFCATPEDLPRCIAQLTEGEPHGQ